MKSYVKLYQIVRRCIPQIYYWSKAFPRIASIKIHYWQCRSRMIEVDVSKITFVLQSNHSCPLFAFLGLFSWLFWVHWFFCCVYGTRRYTKMLIFIELDRYILEKWCQIFVRYAVIINEHVEGNLMCFVDVLILASVIERVRVT